MDRKFKGTPPRLDFIFQEYDPPLYFVTFCTMARQPILACAQVHEAFRVYAQRGQEFNVAVGRYVIMPDHIHVFVRIGRDFSLSRWVKGLKRCLDRTLTSLDQQSACADGTMNKNFWQPGFFDHLLRNCESYKQKWNYAWQNPVRAGLATRAEEWLYQGVIVEIDRV